MSGECAQCRKLEQDVARLERELAVERERANALYVAWPPQAPAPPAPPAPVEEARPLRYELVDSINHLVSRFPGYQLARRAAMRLKR
jgi:hypothetical protein